MSLALGTFWMPVSYDYNLFFLPLAALAVCGPRDPLLVLVALASMTVWWQPFRWTDAMGPDAIMFLKLLSLVGVGLSIVVRAREDQNPRLTSRPSA